MKNANDSNSLQLIGVENGFLMNSTNNNENHKLRILIDPNCESKDSAGNCLLCNSSNPYLLENICYNS